MAALLQYAIAMDEDKKSSLNDWGIDFNKFKERAKESMSTAKGDLSEITGTLRETLLEAKDIVMNLHTGGGPAGAELKGGFERAWHEIESAFKSAREKARSGPESTDPPSDTPAATPDPNAPPEPHV
jgi:hypothetical protein